MQPWLMPLQQFVICGRQLCFKMQAKLIYIESLAATLVDSFFHAHRQFSFFLQHALHAIQRCSSCTARFTSHGTKSSSPHREHFHTEVCGDVVDVCLSLFAIPRREMSHHPLPHRPCFLLFYANGSHCYQRLCC